MRTILVILVLALLVDAFFYSGTYTQSAYDNLKAAADGFVALVSDVVEYGPEGQTSP